MREFLKFLPFFSSFIVPLKTRVLKFFWNVLRPKVFVLIVAFNLESHLHPDIGVKHVLAFLLVILMILPLSYLLQTALSLSLCWNFSLCVKILMRRNHILLIFQCSQFWAGYLTHGRGLIRVSWLNKWRTEVWRAGLCFHPSHSHSVDTGLITVLAYTRAPCFSMSSGLSLKEPSNSHKEHLSCTHSFFLGFPWHRGTSLHDL